MYTSTRKIQTALTTVLLLVGALFLFSPAPAYAARTDGGLNILPYDSPSAAISASPSTGAAPLTVSFKANVLSHNDETFAYLWDFGTGDTSKEANPKYTFTQSGSYTVSLTVASSSEVYVGSIQIHVAAPTRACTVNCLVASNINLKPVADGDTDFIEGTVLVVDERGSALRGAVVTGSWMLPDGKLTAFSAQTDGSGFARVRLQALQSGVYTLHIDEIVKAGYIFDTAHSVRTGSLKY